MKGEDRCFQIYQCPEEMIFELISEGQEECQMREREELDFKEKTGTLEGQGGQVARGSRVEGDW